MIVCAVVGRTQRWNRVSVRLLLMSGGVVVVALVGALFVTGPERGPLLPLVLIIIRFAVIAREERYLTNKFGEEYRRYSASVRRWL